MKKICYVLLFGFSLFTGMLVVDASSASVSISTSTNKVVVGKPVKATVTLRSSGSPLGICGFDLTSSSHLSGGGSIQLDDKCYGSYSKSYSFNFTAKSSGTATITVKNSNITLDDYSIKSPSASKTIKVMTQAELEATYSDNNNLSSLSVEGFELSPAFNQNTLEYKVNLGAAIDKIKVNASKADNTATIKGDGEIEVAEGDNKIEVIVTSQKGNTKTYTIIATVIDENPINVDINNKKYTVVKRANSLTAPTGYETKTIVIDDIEIPAFYSKTTKNTLVGLKDEKGNVDLYIYDEENQTYALFLEFQFKGIIFCPLTVEKIPDGFSKTTITINNKKITAYKYKNDKSFIIIYGTNLETGKSNWYVYNEEENTIQIYNSSYIDDLSELNKKYELILYCVSGTLFLSLLLLIVMVVKNSKKKKTIKKIKNNNIIQETKNKEVENKTKTKKEDK